MKFMLFAAALVAAQFAFGADGNPAGNASELTPPHIERGYTYAKGDPLYRIIHGNNHARAVRNEIAAGEYGWENYRFCANCEAPPKEGPPCVACEDRAGRAWREEGMECSYRRGQFRTTSHACRRLERGWR